MFLRYRRLTADDDRAAGRIIKSEVPHQLSGATLRACATSRPDSELQLVAALRRAVRKRGGPLASIDVADGLLDDAASGPEAAD